MWCMISNSRRDGPIDETEGLPTDLKAEEQDIHWLDATYAMPLGKSMQFLLAEKDYVKAQIFGASSWPMVPRYTEEIRDLVQSCLLFRADDRPTLEELREAIIPHLDADEDPPDLLFGEQTFREGTSVPLAYRPSKNKRKR